MFRLLHFLLGSVPQLVSFAIQTKKETVPMVIKTVSFIVHSSSDSTKPSCIFPNKPFSSSLLISALDLLYVVGSSPSGKAWVSDPLNKVSKGG